MITAARLVADDFQRELAFLGIELSLAFVREPEGNGCAERFIRTRKENCSGSAADTIEELRLSLYAIMDPHNPNWIVERLGYRPPPAAVRAARLAPFRAAVGCRCSRARWSYDSWRT